MVGRNLPHSPHSGVGTSCGNGKKCTKSGENGSTGCHNSRIEYHSQSGGLLNGLVDVSSPSPEVLGEAIMTLLSTMIKAEKSIQRCFARQLVKVVLTLSPGDVLLPEPLQFVYAMVVLLAEGRFDVVILVTNRQVDPNLYYPFR